MKHSRGLNDYMRKQYARAQAGKPLGSMGNRAVETVVSACMTGTPNKLPEEQDKMLRQLANADCFRCKGTGVSRWKRGGTMALVCICVQRKLPEMQAKLEEQQARVQKMLEEEKAKKEPKAIKEEPKLFDVPPAPDVIELPPAYTKSWWDKVKDYFAMDSKKDR